MADKPKGKKEAPPPEPEPAPSAPPVVQPSRPLLIDEGQDGPCELCAKWAAAKYVQDADPETGRPRTRYRCDECGAIIPVMGLMWGRGFKSCAPHHWHLRPVGPGGAPGRQGVDQELCLECYRANRRAVYPEETPEKLERMLTV